MTQEGVGYGLGNDCASEDEMKYSEEEATEFPCSICSATFVTKISLTRHMILHEDDKKTEEISDIPLTPADESPVSPVVVPPIQNLLESILKNGSKAILPGIGSDSESKVQRPGGSAGGRPVPNLKPLPLLIPKQEFEMQQQMKNFQCKVCNVCFGKKEDLARHVTRTHGGARFACPYCGRNISRRDHLKRHIKNVHPEYCTETEIGPFLANPNASRTAKEQHAENFANQYGIAVEPVAKKPKLSLSSSTSELSDSKMPQSEQTQQMEQFLEEDGDDEFEDEEMEDNENGNGIQNLTIEPELLVNNPEVDEPEEDNFADQSYDETEQSQMIQLVALPDLQDAVDDGSNGGPSQEIQSPQRKFKCELCDASFMSKINMQRHMGTHEVIRPHACGVCGKSFLRKEHLTKHLSSVHSGLKYRCQFCNKDISRKDHLLRHIRNCHPLEFMGMPPDMIDSEPQVTRVPQITLSSSPKVKVVALSCDMCYETFHHIDELSEHQSSVHSDVRKFKCERCPKAFKRKEHLEKHYATHMTPATKTYSCCGVQYPNAEALYDHIRRIHGATNAEKPVKKETPIRATPTPVTTSPATCNLCDNIFQSRALLVNHLKAYHGVSNPEGRLLNGPNNTQMQMQRNSHPKFRTKNVKSKKPTWGNTNTKLQSLFGINVPTEENVDGSLDSLMGLINRGSISLSRVSSNH